MTTAADTIRNDEAVQEAAKALFIGCAPERSAELNALWSKHAPRFNLTGNMHEGDRFILDAGCFRDVRFNHRVLRAFWLAGYAAWAGYEAVAKGLAEDADYDLTRFKELIAAFEQVLVSNSPEDDPLPAGVAEPGKSDSTHDVHSRAAADLATMAGGWAFLHELQHLLHQQGGTSAGAFDASPAALRAEELSCDAFATRFLIEECEAYAGQHGVSIERVRQKRELAIYFALFAMTLLTRDNWHDTPTHPSVARRIAAVRAEIGDGRSDAAVAIAIMAFAALKEIWSNAPDFV